MARLTEKYVQKQSMIFLKDYYKNKYNLTRLFARTEVRTTHKRKGYGRADGILCFNSDKQNIHTVSLEAKSHKTLNYITPINDAKKDRLLLLITVTIFLILALVLSQDERWYWIILISVSFAIIAVIVLVFVLVLIEPEGLKKFKVIEQIKRYPANEKWIAISADSLNLVKKRFTLFTKKTNLESLLLACKKNGIGLLVISHKTVKIKIEPTFTKGYFLHNYSIEKEIKKILRSN